MQASGFHWHEIDWDTPEHCLEYWSILVPRKRQRYPPLVLILQHTQSLRHHELVAQNDVRQILNIWPYFAKIMPPTKQWIPSAKCDSRWKLQNLSALERLPAELIATILEDASLGPKDIIALGFSSSSLWRHVLRHIGASYRAAAAPWAGMEMACINHRLRNMPDAFLKDDLPFTSVETLGGTSAMSDARKFVDSDMEEYSVPKLHLMEAQWLANFHHISMNGHRPHLSSSLPELEQQLISTFTTPCFDDTKLTWAFRNLDTYEYITCACASESKTYYLFYPSKKITVKCKRGFVKQKGKICKGLPIEYVLLRRIFWFDKASQDVLDLQGSWAGHRFDIVGIGSTDFPNADGWTDITANVLELESR